MQGKILLDDFKRIRINYITLSLILNCDYYIIIYQNNILPNDKAFRLCNSESEPN